MTEAQVIDYLRAALWAAFQVSLPILTIALIVGLVIGLFQALTSIQELTLTFVPKLAAVFLAFWTSMGFMGQTLISFYTETILPSIAGQ